MLSSIVKNFSKEGFVLKCSSIFKSNKSLNAFINRSIASYKNPNLVKSATSFNKSLNACQAGFTIDRCLLRSISSSNLGKGPNFLSNAFEGKRFKSSKPKKSPEQIKNEILMIKLGMCLQFLNFVMWVMFAYVIYRLFNGPSSTEEVSEMEPLTLEDLLKAFNIDVKIKHTVITEVESDSSNTDTVVQSDDEAPNTDTVVQSDDEASNTDTVVQSDDEAPNTETVVQSDDEAPNTDTVVQSDDEAPNTNTVVQSDDEAIKFIKMIISYLTNNSETSSSEPENIENVENSEGN